MEQIYYGPLWPLPQTTVYQRVLTEGLTGLLETSEYFEAAAKDIIFSAPSTNTGDIYIVTKASDGTFSKSNAGTVVLLISPGGSRNLSQASYSGNLYKLDELGVDADDIYDAYFACAIMQ